MGDTYKISQNYKTDGGKFIINSPSSVEKIILDEGSSVSLYSGAGSPESVVIANKGALFLSTDGTLYVKNTGNGTSTGWQLQGGDNIPTNAINDGVAGVSRIMGFEQSGAGIAFSLEQDKVVIGNADDISLGLKTATTTITELETLTGIDTAQTVQQQVDSKQSKIYTYTVGDLTELNAITGMVNNETAIVLESLDVYIYDGSEWNISHKQGFYVKQTAHGFTVGKVIGYNKSTGFWVLASNNNVNTLDNFSMVASVVDANTFEIHKHFEYKPAVALTPNTRYYLGINGDLTATVPSPLVFAIFIGITNADGTKLYVGIGGNIPPSAVEIPISNYGAVGNGTTDDTNAFVSLFTENAGITKPIIDLGYGKTYLVNPITIAPYVINGVIFKNVNCTIKFPIGTFAVPNRIYFTSIGTLIKVVGNSTGNQYDGTSATVVSSTETSTGSGKYLHRVRISGFPNVTAFALGDLFSVTTLNSGILTPTTSRAMWIKGVHKVVAKGTTPSPYLEFDVLNTITTIPTDANLSGLTLIRCHRASTKLTGVGIQQFYTPDGDFPDFNHIGLELDYDLVSDTGTTGTHNMLFGTPDILSESVNTPYRGGYGIIRERVMCYGAGEQNVAFRKNTVQVYAPTFSRARLRNVYLENTKLTGRYITATEAGYNNIICDLSTALSEYLICANTLASGGAGIQSINGGLGTFNNAISLFHKGSAYEVRNGNDALQLSNSLAYESNIGYNALKGGIINGDAMVADSNNTNYSASLGAKITGNNSSSINAKTYSINGSDALIDLSGTGDLTTGNVALYPTDANGLPSFEKLTVYYGLTLLPIRIKNLIAEGLIITNSLGNAIAKITGTGSPENNITASYGSEYTNTTNGDFYRKLSASSNTGWVKEENFTTVEKTKLSGIAEGAEVNVQADWNQTDNLQDSFIQNKPTLGTVASKDVGNAIGNIQENGAVLGNSAIVETDTTGKFITTSKNTAYNANFGTGNTDVARGDASYIKNDTYTKAEANALLLNKEDSANKGVANGYAGLDSNAQVPLAQLPANVKSSKVVADITARNAITSADRFEGLRVHVLDASSDTTVTSGSAGYILKSGLSNTEWEKTYESESIDVDLSDYFNKTTDTTDNITEGSAKFTTQAEIDKLAGIEANATADQTAAEIKTAYEANLDTNAFTDAEQTKLAGIEVGATANSTDATLLNRANHTGTQTLSTISDSGALASKDTIATTDVDNNAITTAKIQQFASKSVVGRTSAGTGDVEEIDIATTLKADLSLDNVANVDTTTTANVTDSTDKRYVTDTEKAVIANTSGTNTGDETTLSIQTKRPLKTIANQIVDGSGDISLTKSDVGLDNVDNTSDADKPVSTAQQTALDGKLAKASNLSDVPNRQTALDNLTNVASATNEYILTKDTATGNAIFKPAPGGGSGTNLSIGTTTSTTLDINSDTGNNATIPGATLSVAGLLTSADKGKLDGVEANATANSTDATLLNRANHTGEQAISTITGLQAALDGINGMPVGAVMYFYDAVPTGFFELNGSTFDQSLYPQLYAANNSSNTLPDYRGYFLRAFGTNSDGVASGSLRALQADATAKNGLQTSRLTRVERSGNDVASNNTYPPANGRSNAIESGANDSYFFHNEIRSDSVSSTDTETRPHNIALYIAIKHD